MENNLCEELLEEKTYCMNFLMYLENIKMAITRRVPVNISLFFNVPCQHFFSHQAFTNENHSFN